MSANDIPSERPVPEAWRWYYYIHMCGAEGRDWVEKYDQANGWDVAARLDHIIALCRRSRVDEAQRMLAGCFDDLGTAERNSIPSVASVMRRWCLSTKAYLRYHCRDYQEARSLLDQSIAAIRDAISQAPFLIGLAAGCAELTVHCGRMARDERRWSAMRDYFSRARAMCGDALPLCELADGSRIFVGDFYRFVESLEPQNEEEKASLTFIRNPQVLARGIEILIRRVEASPNIVVPFE